MEILRRRYNGETDDSLMDQYGGSPAMDALTEVFTGGDGWKSYDYEDDVNSSHSNEDAQTDSVSQEPEPSSHPEEPDVEPMDVDGDGEPLEDQGVIEHDEEVDPDTDSKDEPVELVPDDDILMLGGASSGKAIVVTATSKFPFILKAKSKLDDGFLSGGEPKSNKRGSKVVKPKKSAKTKTSGK